MALDADSWAPPVVSLFTSFGNGLANDSWEGNRRELGSAPPLVPPGATADERLALIRNKYEARLFVSAELAEQARGPEALREAVAGGDVPRVMALLAGGAKATEEEAGKVCALCRRAAAACPLASLPSRERRRFRLSRGAVPTLPAAQPSLMHVAAALGDAGAAVVAALLLNGADALAANAEGLTPADAAKAAGAAEDGPLLTVLQRFSAKRI